MASNDLAIRFTEKKYATKQEVMKTLNIGVVDSVWNVILKYREQFSRDTELSSIDHKKLWYCMCPSISEKISEAEMMLVNAVDSYHKIELGSFDYRQFEKQCKIKILESIAKNNNLTIDSNYLRMIVDNQIKIEAPAHKILPNYLNALKKAESLKGSPVDADLLAALLLELEGNEELLSFYRTKNDKNPINKVVIDRIYSCAPAHLIDPMMENLFNFINSSTLNPLAKAITAYYYICLVKPFIHYNEEIALLVYKFILQESNVQELGYLLNLEELAALDVNEMQKIFDEVQKTGDLTYLMVKALEVILRASQTILDDVVKLNISSIKREYEPSVEDLVEEDLAKPSEVISEESLIEEEKVEEVKPVLEETKVEEVTPLEEAPISEEKPLVEEEKPLVEEVKVKTKKPVKEKLKFEKARLAVSFIPVKIDEEEAKLLEEHLLEADPCLRKGQAYFYARHCTIGMRYTIQQYKKATGCAYETARTSMDMLAELGYYRQEMVKNKKVYTPVDKK